MQITNKLSSGCVRMHALPCMTLCDHKDGSPTGFCVYGSFQARLQARLPFPPQEDFPDLRIKTSPTFTLADGYPTIESLGKP